MAGKCAVDCQQIGSQDAQGRRIAHERVQRQGQDVLVVGKAKQQDPARRLDLEVEPAPALFVQPMLGFARDLVSRETGEVDGLQRQHRRVLDMLGDPAAGMGGEARAQDGMAPLDQRQRLDEGCRPQRATQAQRQQLMPKLGLRADLRQGPDAALGTVSGRLSARATPVAAGGAIFASIIEVSPCGAGIGSARTHRDRHNLAGAKALDAAG